MAITRFRNSSIRNRGPKYNDFLAGLPFRPIIGTATDGGTGTTVSVAFTGNNPAGAGITYTALSSPGNITATGPASPITVTGLTSGTAYTFQVKAGNSLGDSAYSSASNSVTPVTPTAFESIATVTVGSGGASTVEFTSIPGSYQHLQIRGIMASSASGSSRLDMIVRANNSSGTNYAWHSVRGNGASAAVYGNYDASEAKVPFSVPTSGYTNQFGAFILDIHDYASTTKYKTMRQLGGSDNNGAGAINPGSGLWMSTSAITSIQLIMDSSNFVQNSTFALYGIKGA